MNNYSIIPYYEKKKSIRIDGKKFEALFLGSKRSYLLLREKDILKMYNLINFKLISHFDYEFTDDTFEFLSKYNLLISTGQHYDLILWNLNKNCLSRKFSAHSSKIYSIKKHSVLDLIVSNSFDGTIKLWDLRLNKPIKILKKSSKFSKELIFKEESPHLIYDSFNKSIILYDIISDKVTKILKNHRKKITKIEYSPFSNYFSSISKSEIFFYRNDGAIEKSLNSYVKKFSDIVMFPKLNLLTTIDGFINEIILKKPKLYLRSYNQIFKKYHHLNKPRLYYDHYKDILYSIDGPFINKFKKKFKKIN